MKIFSKHQWHDSHTDLSKYFLRRFAQLVDTDEVISNRHPTTNGLILFEELYDIVTLCLRRWKNRFRLRALLMECADRSVKTSIVNDPILTKYFRPGVEDAKDWSKKELSPELAAEVQRNSLKHVMAVRPEYVDRIRSEFDSIDLSSNNFDTFSRKIDNLLIALIPQLLYEGHSVGFLQLAPSNLGRSRLEGLIERLFGYFSLTEDRTYNCFVTEDVRLDPQLLDLLQADRKTLTAEVLWENQELLDGYAFVASGKDPFSAVRNTTIQAFRKLSLRKPDTDSNTLTPFWTTSYYEGRGDKYAKYNFIENSDPIISPLRANTLKNTLDKLENELDAVPADILEKLEEPLYFYNLARAVPSVENSYILLWTALEALMGLRTDQPDIEIVQTNVAQSVALGSVGRRVNSTVQRLRTLGRANDWPYLGPGASEYDRTGLCDWIVWLTDRSTQDTQDDPFCILKEDPLLCKQYRYINENWKNLSVLHDIIVASERNLRYQLDRVYLTRNTIIHSGHFGHTGTYLWIHLEWYVGKLLAEAISTLDGMFGQLSADPRDMVFGGLQGQYRSTVDYLSRHSNESITFDRLIASGISRFPALCF